MNYSSGEHASNQEGCTRAEEFRTAELCLQQHKSLSSGTFGSMAYIVEQYDAERVLGTAHTVDHSVHNSARSSWPGTRPTPRSLEGHGCSDLVNLYSYVVQKGIEPHIEL